MQENPDLATERLRLRPIAIEDLDELHALWRHPDVRRFLFDDREIQRAAAERIVRESIDGFAARGFGLYRIDARDRPGLVGFAGLKRLPGGSDIELLYGLAPEHWGRGLATEAARAVLAFGFERVGLPRIVAQADAPNLASIAVMKRLGMRFEWRRSEDGRLLVQYALAAFAPGDAEADPR